MPLSTSLAFISSGEASRITGLSQKALADLARQGGLEVRSKGNPDIATWQFSRRDIERLARLRRQGKSIAAIYDMALTSHLTAKRMLDRLEQVELAMGINSAPADLTVEGVLALYDEASNLASASIVKPSQLKTWGSRLLTMDEAFLEAAEAHIADPEPWVPFLLAADHLATFARANKNSPLWTIANNWLQAGRNHLRNIAYFYQQRTKPTTKKPPDKEDRELLLLLGILQE